MHGWVVEHITRVDADVVKSALKLAERAKDAWTIRRTKFLSPLGVRAVMQEMEKLAEVSAVSWGGYPHSERQRVLIMRDELITTHEHDLQNIAEIVPVKVSGNFLLLKAKHSDFLGALSGIGLKSEDIGDIIIEGDTGCLTFASPKVAAIIQSKLKSVRAVPVRAERVPYDDIVLPLPRVKEIKTVEPSMRLDALCSAAFGISRDKMVDRIKAGDVTVNWNISYKPTAAVQEGDIIGCHGKGRAEIRKVTTTKKMRYAVSLTTYS